VNSYTLALNPALGDPTASPLSGTGGCPDPPRRWIACGGGDQTPGPPPHGEPPCPQDCNCLVWFWVGATRNAQVIGLTHSEECGCLGCDPTSSPNCCLCMAPVERVYYNPEQRSRKICTIKDSLNHCTAYVQSGVREEVGCSLKCDNPEQWCISEALHFACCETTGECWDVPRGECTGSGTYQSFMYTLEAPWVETCSGMCSE
jgi:hypothetical protein